VCRDLGDLAKKSNENWSIDQTNQILKYKKNHDIEHAEGRDARHCPRAAVALLAVEVRRARTGQSRHSHPVLRAGETRESHSHHNMPRHSMLINCMPHTYTVHSGTHVHIDTYVDSAPYVQHNRSSSPRYIVYATSQRTTPNHVCHVTECHARIYHITVCHVIYTYVS
jgi:hypothetical protein